MIEKTLKQKLNHRGEVRTAAQDAFCKPFDAKLTKAFIAGILGMKEEEVNPDGYKMYHYHSFITSNVMTSSSLEEFILKMCLLRKEAAEKFGFDNEFDWVNHACVSAQLYAGKGDMAMKCYSWAHASYKLIKHYEIKSWEMLLDASEGNPEEIHKQLPFLEKETMAYNMRKDPVTGIALI